LQEQHIYSIRDCVFTVKQNVFYKYSARSCCHKCAESTDVEINIKNHIINLTTLNQFQSVTTRRLTGMMYVFVNVIVALAMANSKSRRPSSKTSRARSRSSGSPRRRGAKARSRSPKFASSRSRTTSNRRAR